MKKTFNIITLGCKVNSYESEFIRSLFLREGFIQKEKADVYIINTCTVTNNSDNKSKKIIRRIRNNYPDSILIVTGCFVEYVKDKANEFIDADIILGNQDKSKIIEYLNEYIENKNRLNKIKEIDNSNFENMEINKSNSHTRAFVKVQDGCNNFCSYCIIPYVRGRVRSKLRDNVLNEIKSLVNNNTKEIVLTGIHIGQYGIDLKDYRLSDLISDILKIKGLLRLRLSSIEVVEIDENLLKMLKSSKILVSHLHIPLQSGCDKILKLMNRRYDLSYFRNKVNEIRKIRPEISITTDVIVGFPGETEKDFNETYNFCKEINFSKIHVFPYSDRNGTVASKLDDKILGNIKRERVKKLIELSSKLEESYYNSFIGSQVEVLIEEYKDEYYFGHTSNYLYLKIKGDYKVNEIYNIILE